MPAETAHTPRLSFHPLTPDRWPDLEALFGPNGACGGCWCMWWRLTRSEFAGLRGEERRQLFNTVVHSGRVPGILAYADGRPAGWCSVAPREDFPSLERSPILKRVDAEPVWSIVCFYTRRGLRRRGLMAGLLRAAVEYARGQGARIVEGYPVEPQGPIPASMLFTGTASAFRAAGFVEVARRSPKRPIMRLVL